MNTQKNHKPKGLLGILVLCLAATGGYFLQPPAREPAARTTRQTARQDDPAQTFTGFSRWVDTFSKAEPAGRPALTAEGIQLARQRRVTMEALMKSDPRLALEQAVTLDVWRNLPPGLRAEVEEPFSAIADYRVLPVCITGSPDAGRVAAGEKFPDASRWTTIDGHPPLESHVYGRREGLGSKDKSPVQGIRLGTLAVLREGVFQELDGAETTAAESIYPLADESDRDFATGAPLGGNPVIALAGGKIFKFADHTGFENFSKSIEALDEKPGPRSGSSVLFLPMPANGSTGFNLADAVALSDELASAWTETKKKVFMIRCDFSDKPDSTNPVVLAGTYGTLLNTTVSDSIRDFSYGKTWIEATVSSDIIRLPQTSSYYATDTGGGTTRNSQILSDAKAAYQTAHPAFVASSYDIIGIWFVSTGMKGSGVTYAGLASINGPDLWIQGSSDAGVHAHEFGHNYGIGHSSFWTPSVGSTNPVDPSGSYEEYGDPFDVMGNGTVPDGVFHSEAKQRLNWLATGTWTDATAGGSGTYRLQRIDHPNTTGVRGIRVTKGGGDYYWLNYRRLIQNSWLRAGASIVWQRSASGRSWLIDTTPGSVAGSLDRNDGSLAIGRTYSDGNSHITPLARGGTAPNEYLDIRVNTGPFAGNVAPTVTIAGPSSIGARQTCIFTAQATDANGDALAYSWDFGQGFTFDNRPSAAFAWNSGGTYLVKVTVSDMKGNTAQATKSVTVTDPITTWTTRANTSAGDFKALVASPNKVLAIGEDFGNSKGPVATSTNGTTWTATLLANNQHVQAGVWDGSQFLLAGQDYNFSAPAGWKGCVFTSPTANSGTWTRRIFTGSPLNGIAYGGGVYVTVGEVGTIRRSTDGITWTLVSSGTTNTLSSVSYGGGKFVALGYVPFNGDSTVLTSTDGNTWTNTSAGAGVDTWQDLRYITWANNRFIASGWYGKLRHSTDLGVSFSTTRTTTEDTPALAYGNGIWFAAGTDKYNSDAETDLVSTDGSNWTSLTTPSLDDRNAAIFFNNTFITAGDNHSIRQSATILPAALGYYSWRETNFPDHGPSSGPDEDGDGDGIANLMEYFLARSPLTGSADDGPASLPQAITVSSEPVLTGRLVLQTVMPDPSALDLSCVVEAASSPGGPWTALATKVGNGSWTWNAGGTSRIVVGTPSAGRVTVKVGDSVTVSGNPRRFLRLRGAVIQ